MLEKEMRTRTTFLRIERGTSTQHKIFKILELHSYKIIFILFSTTKFLKFWNYPHIKLFLFSPLPLPLLLLPHCFSSIATALVLWFRSPHRPFYHILHQIISYCKILCFFLYYRFIILLFMVFFKISKVYKQIL